MQHLLTASIIGPEGTDISGIADNYKAKGSDESTEPAEPEAESVPEEEEEAPNTKKATDGQRILASPLAKKMTKEFS
jgi:pyruvate dehydrogenase E2 component (dihydrolipoamide acetyltransferase)